jgi:hypothetical protein
MQITATAFTRLQTIKLRILNKADMAADDKIDRKTLFKALKTELAFFDKGGYGKPFRSGWRPTLLLRDSPVCLNFNATGRQASCDRCPFFSLVPAADRDALLPCHHIPLDAEGNTIAGMYRKTTQKELDERYHNWLTALTRKNETN